MKKHCPQCGKTKSTTEFNKKVRNKDGLQTHCRSCCKANNKEHYENNKAQYSERNLKRITEIRKDFQILKANLKCSRCGENHPATLDFHHQDPTEKESSVANLVTRGYSKERVEQEIAKCVILCANCHRKEHYGRLSEFG